MYYLVLLFISIILYFLAPQGPSFVFSLLCVFVFFVGAYPLTKKTVEKSGIISFNILFLTAFFLTSFCCPLLIVPFSNVLFDYVEIGGVNISFINNEYVSKAVALCVIGINCYFAGYQKEQNVEYESIDQLKDFNLKSLRICYYIAFIAVFINTVLFFTKNIDSINVTDNYFLYEIFKSIYVVCFVALSSKKQSGSGLKSFLEDNFSVITPILILSLFMLFWGDRDMIIFSSLSILAVYSFFYARIRVIRLGVFALIFVLLLFIVRQTRNSDYSIKNVGIVSASRNVENTMSGNPLFLFSDLIGINQELNVSYEIKEKTGLHYPGQIILLPFLPIPRLPSILSEYWFHEDINRMFGSNVLNDYIIKETGLNPNFGNHPIGEFYLVWGMMGVIIGFFILGKIIGLIETRRFSSTLCLIFWIYLIGYSIHFARASVLMLPRSFLYIYLIYLIFKSEESA